MACSYRNGESYCSNSKEGSMAVVKAEDLVKHKKLKTPPNIPNLLKSNQMLVFCEFMCVVCGWRLNYLGRVYDIAIIKNLIQTRMYQNSLDTKNEF
jgi:hypothetical protein